MPWDPLVQPSEIVVSVSSLLRGAIRTAGGRALGVTVGRKPTLRVLRALWITDALTERRTTEWAADAETRTEAMPVVGVPRFRRPW